MGDASRPELRRGQRVTASFEGTYDQPSADYRTFSYIDVVIDGRPVQLHLPTSLLTTVDSPEDDPPGTVRRWKRDTRQDGPRLLTLVAYDDHANGSDGAWVDVISGTHYRHDQVRRRSVIVWQPNDPDAELTTTTSVTPAPTPPWTGDGDPNRDHVLTVRYAGPPNDARHRKDYLYVKYRPSTRGSNLPAWRNVGTGDVFTDSYVARFRVVGSLRDMLNKECDRRA